VKTRNRQHEIHFYEWYISRWQTSDAHDELDAAGRGIYREMLDVCYAQGSVTSDAAILCRRCACTSEELESRWAVIRRHFQAHKKDKGKLVNAHANLVRRDYFAYVRQQKRKGALGGRKKGTQNANEDNEIPSTSLATAKPLVKPDESQEQEQEQEQEGRTEKSTPPAPSFDFPGLLDEIYAAWKKKTGKQLAGRELSERLQTANGDQGELCRKIRDKALAFAASEAMAETEARFWPKLADWIRDRKDEDDPEPEYQPW